MDRKIDNMKMSYDKMVGFLKEQLRLVTLDRPDEDSVELDDTIEDESVEESITSNTETSSIRPPLAAASPSSIQQQSSSEGHRSKDAEQSANLRKSHRVASRTSEASESICVETENMLKTTGTAKRYDVTLAEHEETTKT